MSAVGASLSESAFIADLTPREKSFWRFVVTVLVTAFGGVPIALVSGLVAALVFGALAGLFQGDIHLIVRKVGALIDPSQVSVTSSIGLMVLVVATNGALALTLVGAASAINARRFRKYVTIASKVRWRMLACGLVLSFLVLAPTVIIGRLLDPHAPPAPLFSLASGWWTRAGYLVGCFALLIPAAAAEEIAFRGWLLRETAALTRNPIFLMAVNGILFSAVHGQFDPSAFLLRSLMGAGFVYMTLRLGGIEFSTGAHAANNILIVLFIQPLTAALPAAQPMSWLDLVQDVYLLASYLLMAELTARWTPLRRWSGADLGGQSKVAETFA